MPASEMVERVLLPRSSRCRTTFTVRVTPASTLAVAVSRKKPGSDAVNLEPPGESPRALKIPCWCVRTVRVSPVGTLLTDTLTFGSGAPDAFATVPWIPPLLWAHPRDTSKYPDQNQASEEPAMFWATRMCRSRDPLPKCQQHRTRPWRHHESRLKVHSSCHAGIRAQHCHI